MRVALFLSPLWLRSRNWECGEREAPSDFRGIHHHPYRRGSRMPCLQLACSVSPVALIPPPVLAPLVTRALLASIFLPTPFPLFIPFLPLAPKPVVERRTPPWTLLRGLHVYPTTVESKLHESYILRMLIWYYYWNIWCNLRLQYWEKLIPLNKTVLNWKMLAVLN